MTINEFKSRIDNIMSVMNMSQADIFIEPDYKNLRACARVDAYFEEICGITCCQDELTLEDLIALLKEAPNGDHKATYKLSITKIPYNIVEVWGEVYPPANGEAGFGRIVFGVD